MNPSQLSFLPDDYLARKAARRANVICASLLAVVVAGVGGTLTVNERLNQKVEREHAAVEAQFDAAAERIHQAQLMQEKQRKVAHQAELSASLLEKVPRSNVLAELTNDRPPGVYLLSFQLESKRHVTPPPVAAAPVGPLAGGPPTPKPPAAKKDVPDGPVAEPLLFDVDIKVTGVAGTDVQVAQYISKLDRCKMFKDVNLVESMEFVPGLPNGTPDKEKELAAALEKVRKFQIEMTLDPDSDVRPTDPARTGTLNAGVPATGSGSGTAATTAIAPAPQPPTASVDPAAR